MSAGILPGATLIENGQMGHAAYDTEQGVVFFGSAGPASLGSPVNEVPEPGGAGALAIAAMGLLTRRAVARKNSALHKAD